MMRQLWKRTEFSVLLAGIIVAFGLWSFQELVEVARDSTAHNFDTGILLALREPSRPDDPIGPAWLEEAVRDITSLGSTSVLVLVTLGAVIYLLMIRQRFEAMLVLFTVVGGQILSSLLKLGIDRPRPELVSHLVDVHTLSFPSGHAMLSAVVYMTLGSLLAGHATSRTLKIYVLGVAVLLTFLVGASRAYLGVHWPSDILAGWSIGFAWAMACWLAARWLAGRAESAK
jgi:undecaprenyl-diphosphatase